MALDHAHAQCLAFIILITAAITTTTAASDSEILLKFKDSLGNNGRLSSWTSSTPPCSSTGRWAGVLCENTTVYGLQLEHMGLKGSNIDIDTLSQLKSLRTVSFMYNELEGSLPNIKKLGGIKSVYLSNNKFSGIIQAESFDGMLKLRKVHLANNGFSGFIPLSLAMLPKLKEVRLEGNHLTGEIPAFMQPRLMLVNVSNNNLKGPIPSHLAKMPATAFYGNSLCGAPLKPCASSSSLSVATIVILVVVIVMALAAIAALMFIMRKRRQAPVEENSPPGHRKADSEDLSRMEQGSAGNGSSRSSKRAADLRLSFVRDDRERFDLADLLKASAEILGSGSFGASYKAAISSGQVMVVKRFKKMNNASKEEFQEHMRRLGRLRHENLLPLVAFYYRKEEKLLVSDYIDNVSLAVHLHGNNSLGQPSLDWPTRLRIIKGVARGLVYLQSELPSLIAPHGHLKSSNVLLNQLNEPVLTDYGLIPVVNAEQAKDLLVAYKSPEYKQQGRVTKKTDVWSLGILILETLTGKFPANHLHKGKASDTDVAAWVNSIVREELTGEVFDKEMGQVKGCEAEMMKLLKIGIACCESDVAKRYDLKEALAKIEEVNESGDQEDFYSSYASEGDIRSSRGMSDDFKF